MKKQILFLSLLVLAVLAGVTNSYGQGAIKNANPSVWVSPTCGDDAAHPAAGKDYTYTVKIPVSGETDFYAGYDGNGVYDWYVTQDANLLDATKFMANGTDFNVAASGSSTYHSSTGTTSSIIISWEASAIASGAPYYLVVRYNEVNESGDKACDSENIKVYIIEPQNSFWLDINPSTVAGVTPTWASWTAATYDICAAPIKSATISGTNVEYTFENNILYAVVHAGGYEGNWDGSLQISGLVTDQTITGITWDVMNSGTPAGSPANMTPPSAAPVSGSPQVWEASFPSTVDGTDILVAITIANNHHEGLIDQGITIAIDGSYTTTVNGTDYTYEDLSNASGTDCSQEDAYADYVIETIKARPAVNPVIPTGFMPSPTRQP